MHYESHRLNGFTLSDDVWFEICSFILADPMYHTAKYRSMTGMLLQSVGCIAQVGTGIYPKYFPVNMTDPFPTFQGYETAQLSINDAGYYSYFFEKLTGDIKELKEKGLPLTSALLSNFLFATPTKEVLSALTAFKAFGFYTGYGKGQLHLAHQAQLLNDVSPLTAPSGKHPWGKYITDLYYNIIKWGHERGYIPNERAWKRMFPDILKATSAGLPGEKVRVAMGSAHMGGRAISKEGRKSKLNATEKWFDMKLSDKKMLGLFKPDYFFNFPALDLLYTFDQPGVIGSRAVPGGKANRAIVAIALNELNFNSILTNSLNQYVNGLNPDWTNSYGSQNDFVAGKEVGAKFADDFVSAYSTTDDSILNGGADYTLYDTTEKFDNSRVYELAGVEQALIDLGLTGPFNGIEGGLIEINRKLHSDGIAYNGIFKSGPMPPDFLDRIPNYKTRPRQEVVDEINKIAYDENLKFRFFLLDEVRSGELGTLALNGLNNQCNFKTWFDVYKPTYMQLLRLRIQGDDSETQWKLTPGSVFDVNAYREYVDTFAQASGENGLVLKPEKFNLRMSYAEFLQVSWWLGIYLPKPVVAVFATEAPFKEDTFSSTVSSYAGKMSTLVSRGFNDKLAARFALWMTSFVASVSDRSTYGVNAVFRVPITASIVPKKSGGAGMLPWTSVGANTDTVITEWYSNLSIEQRRYMDLATAITSAKLPSDRDQLAKKLNSDSPDVIPRDPFANGRQFIRESMLQDRFEKSIVANNLLATIGVDLRGLKYESYPTTFLTDSVRSNGQLGALDFLSKSKAVGIYSTMLNPKPMIKDYQWVDAFRFHFIEDITPVMGPVHPFMALDDDVSMMFQMIGVTRSKQRLVMRPARLLAILRQDPFFRKDIRDTSMVEILSSPKLYGNRDLIQLTLIGIGARSDLAAEVAELFLNRAQAFIFKASLAGISLNDSAASNLDLSIENHIRLVDVPDILHRELQDVLYMHSMSMIISHGLRTGEWKRVRVEVGQQSVFKAFNDFIGKIQRVSDKYMNLYPAKEWETDTVKY
jgi:hypothetical protein